MNLRQLQYVLAVAEERSFSKAAKKLFIAQPSLSQYIQNLEQQMGVELFDRTSTPIQITYAGELYIETARKILDLNRQLNQKIADVADLKKGRLIIGLSPYRCAYLIPSVFPIFYQKFPGIQIVLVEKTSKTELEDLARKGEIDIIVSSLPIRENEFSYIPIISEDILLAVPPQYELNHKYYREEERNSLPQSRNFATINLKEFKESPFVLLQPDQDLHKVAQTLCKDAGFTPWSILENRSIAAAHHMVLAGIGVSFMPYSLVRYGNFAEHPYYYYLENSRPKRETVVFYRRESYLSAPALAFISILKDVLNP